MYAFNFNCEYHPIIKLSAILFAVMSSEQLNKDYCYSVSFLVSCFGSIKPVVHLLFPGYLIIVSRV